MYNGTIMTTENNPKNMVIYHILIDRFAGFKKNKQGKSGDEWMGGTLRGIEQKLPYLKRLGINALRLSSPLQSAAYHGYAVTDLTRIDSHFGTTQDLKRLIQKAHARGIRVFIDYIATHCSSNHPFFKSALRSKKSKYRKWFSFERWPTRYSKFLNYYNDLPKWNHKNRATRTYLINNAISWIKKLDCDGFFLDHAIGAPTSFWKEFAQRIHAYCPNSILIGEVWFASDTNPHILPSIKMNKARYLITHKQDIESGIQDAAMQHYVHIFNGCIDFTANDLLRRFLIKRTMSEKAFYAKLTQHYQRFPSSFLLPFFLDSHDTNRFLWQVKNNINTLRRALSIQYHQSQPKLIYYGSEIGLTQKKKWNGEQGFTLARKKMIWDPKKQNKKLLAWYQALNRTCQTQP